MKINLGGSKMKKEFFPIGFDSSTTSNFGECVPAFCHEVVSDTHLSLDMRSAVRLAPLTLPTFGKAFLHSYAFFHKFCDLWKPYNDFLARTPYTNGSGTSYVPTQVPSLNMSLLWYMVLAHSSWSAWYVLDSKVQSVYKSPLSVGSFSVRALYIPSASVQAINDGLVMTLAKSLNFSYLVNYLASATRLTNLIYSRTGSQTPHSPSTFIPSTEDDNVSAVSDDAIYPAGADFMVQIDPAMFQQLSSDGTFSQYTLPDPSFNSKILLTFKLNNSGKFLRKIFLGLGYQIKRVPSSAAGTVSMLPLFAFYKSYFSTFAPKRFVKYEQTYFGRVMTALENTGKSLRDVLFTDTVFTDGCPLPGFIDDLLACFYTQDTDYYSSQILGLVNDYGSDISQNYLAMDSTGESVFSSNVTSDVVNNGVPTLGFDGTGLGHTQSQQNVLSRLTNMVNRRSLVGGKIADFLESTFGISKKDVLDDDNPYIGSTVSEVEFSDVFSTAETAEGSLGEYAGRAIGKGGNRFSINCSSPGLVLVFSTLVPRTQKVQGVNPNLFHIGPSDYYNPQFDGITLLPTNKLGLYAVDSIIDPDITSTSVPSFGNQSLFAEYKTRTQGVLNGDLSLLSTKSSYDSFTLDQTIANYVAQDSTGSSHGNVSFVITAPHTIYLGAGTMWRYIGRWLWLGNFDRIFVNTRQQYTTDYPDYANITFASRDTHVTDDNLIIHNVVDMKINAPMLPLEDSYMTRDLEDLSNGAGVRSQGE